MAKSKWADQAALEALVRFGPQLDVLKQAQRQAKSTYSSQVAQADAGRVGEQQAIDAVLPKLAGVYDDAGLSQHRSGTLLGNDLQGLGGVADSIKAAASLEAAGGLGRLAESKASAVGGLQQQRVQAVTAANARKQQAGSTLISELEKIMQSSKDLSGQKGAFEASTIGTLTDKDLERSLRESLANANNAQSERNSVRSSGIDPATGQPIPGGKLDPKAQRPRATADKHLEWQTGIQEIQNFASRYKGKVDAGKMTRAQLVKKLTQGRAQQDVYVDADGHAVDKNDSGAVKVKLSKIPQFAPDLRMTAALDVALLGHLSKSTQRKLQQSGFSVRQLGVPTYGDGKRKRRAKKPAATPSGVFTAPIGPLTLRR